MGKKKSQPGDELLLLAWAELQSVPEIADIVQLVAGFDLTAGQRRALAVKTLPQSALWSEKKKAEMAQISQRQWYNIQRSPKFQSACVEASRLYLGRWVPEITASFVRDAILGNSANQVCALRQVGILSQEKSDTNINVSVALVEEARNQKLERGMSRFGAVVAPVASDN